MKNKIEKIYLVLHRYKQNQGGEDTFGWNIIDE